MCDFMPRNPSELPTSRWVSYQRLFQLLQPHDPTEVWLKGSDSLKQLIIEWQKMHQAFAGFEVSAYCSASGSRRTTLLSSSFASRVHTEVTPYRPSCFYPNRTWAPHCLPPRLRQPDRQPVDGYRQGYRQRQYKWISTPLAMRRRTRR